MTLGSPGPALLFCPGDRPDRFDKAAQAADLVILDLEDAVADDCKELARQSLVSNLLDPATVIVRINAYDSPEHAADLQALASTPYKRLMLPKAEHAEQIESLSQWQVIALCETARGILNASDIASSDGVIALMWGAEDLIASTHGRTSRWPSGQYRDVARQARSAVLLAAAAHGVAAIDSVYIDILDVDGLAVEAEDAAASGFAMKACIHPSQVDVVRRAFRPGQTQLSWARKLAASAGTGVIAVDGQMVDAPLRRQAEQILSAAEPNPPQ